MWARVNQRVGARPGFLWLPKPMMRFFCKLSERKAALQGSGALQEDHGSYGRKICEAIVVVEALIICAFGA